MRFSEDMELWQCSLNVALATKVVEIFPQLRLLIDVERLIDDTPYEETPWSDQNSHETAGPEWESDARPNAASRFEDIHQLIKDTITELDGSVVPKLNWSSPKDAL